MPEDLSLSITFSYPIPDLPRASVKQRKPMHISYHYHPPAVDYESRLSRGPIGSSALNHLSSWCYFIGNIRGSA